MSEGRSKFRTNFSHTYPKNSWAIVFKLLSVTHLPSKVDCFEFLINWSNIVCIMTHKRTRCKIHITHLMIIGAC